MQWGDEPEAIRPMYTDRCHEMREETLTIPSPPYLSLSRFFVPIASHRFAVFANTNNAREAATAQTSFAAISDPHLSSPHEQREREA